MQALVIRDTGESERIDLPDFASLQKACGGTVVYEDREPEHIDGQYVESPTIMQPGIEHLTMWCNEEARNLGMMPNPKATLLAGWWGQEPPTEEEAAEMGYDFVIVIDPNDGIPMWMLTGDVVFTGPTGRDGDRTPLSDQDADKLEWGLAKVAELQNQEAKA